MEKICSSLVSESFMRGRKKAVRLKSLYEGEIDAWCEKGGCVKDVWGFEEPCPDIKKEVNALLLTP